MIRSTDCIAVNSWFTGQRTNAPFLRAVCRTYTSSGVCGITEAGQQVVHGMGGESDWWFSEPSNDKLGGQAGIGYLAQWPRFD
jgi:hypothetical protein